MTSPTATETRIRGLAIVIGARSQFAALAFDGDRVMRQLRGSADHRDDYQLLAQLGDGVPIVTDAPRSASELLQKAVGPTNVIWDVLELASLLVPACPRDGLDRAAAFFDIVVEGTGLQERAQRLLMLFELLMALIDRLDTQTLLHVTRLAGGLDWPLSSLFAEVLRHRALSPLETGALADGTPIGGWIAQGAASRRRRADQPAANGPPEALIDPAEVTGHLAPDGAIARALPGYEARAEQVEMAHLVTETLNVGGQLLLEAGTGTGKSLAYLLPAALKAVRNQQRVVVSTATTTLQDQLFEHDLLLVQAALGDAEPLRATVLKGRTNYACLRRWQAQLHAPDLSPADRMLLIKTLFWLPRTASGDRAELHLSPVEEDAWQRICAVTEACTPQRCPYHRIGVCFLARARRAAEDSHIVIANHALLLSDLASRSRVLPSYDVLIVDEAHHLEDEATQQLGWRLGERELINRLDSLWNAGASGSGTVSQALALIAAESGARLPTDLRPTIERGEHAVAQLAAGVRRAFETLGHLLDDPELLSASGDDASLRVTAAVRAGSGWQELEQVWADAAGHHDQLERTLIEVIAELEGLPGQSDTARDVAAESGTGRRCTTAPAGRQPRPTRCCSSDPGLR